MSEVKSYTYRDITFESFATDVKFVMLSDYQRIQAELDEVKISETDRHILEWSKKRLQDQLNLNVQELLNAYKSQAQEVSKNDLEGARKTIDILTNCLERIYKALDNNEVIENGGPTHWYIGQLLGFPKTNEANPTPPNGDLKESVK